MGLGVPGSHQFLPPVLFGWEVAEGQRQREVVGGAHKASGGLGGQASGSEGERGLPT